MSRIWSLTKEYVHRAKKPLQQAGLHTLCFVIVFASLPIGGSLILFYAMGLCLLVAFVIAPGLKRVLPPMPTQSSIIAIIAGVVGISLGIVGPISSFIFPHYFLFFSALPHVMTGAIFTLSVFLTNFDVLIRSSFPDYAIGEDFSLVKIILNPRARLDRLYRHLVRRPTALELSTTDRDMLIDRLNRALNQLPDKAFIPLNAADFSIRNEHDPTKTFEAITQTINPAYLNSLTEAQQIKYKEYRHLTSKLRPIAASCVMSAENVQLATQNNFILVEKRTLANGGGLFDSEHPINAVPVTTFVYDRTHFDTLASSNNPRIPENNDLINTPLDWNNRATEYKHHSYMMVQDHPLSLALCEAIEAFNVSLGLAPRAGSSTPKRPNTPAPNAAQPDAAPIILPTCYVSERQRKRQEQRLTAQRAEANAITASSEARRSEIAAEPPSSRQDLTYPPTLFNGQQTNLRATAAGEAQNPHNAIQNSSGPEHLLGRPPQIG